MQYVLFLQIVLVLAAFVVVVLAGGHRRLGLVMTFILSILLTPIGGFLLAWLSGPRQRKPKKRKRKRWFSWGARQASAQTPQASASDQASGQAVGANLG